MPYQSIEFNIDGVGWVSSDQRADFPGQDELGIRVNGIGKNGFMEVMYADIPGSSWNQNRLNKFMERAQDEIDLRIDLNDTELASDPDAQTDPARPDFFHDTAGSANDLVSRPVIISNVRFDGVLLFDLLVTRRN